MLSQVGKESCINIKFHDLILSSLALSKLV